MSIKNKGVKISIAHEPEVESKKSPVIRKNVVAPKKKIVKKTVVRKSIPQKKKSSKEDKGVMQTSIAIIITAMIVGGGIYFWQNSEGENKVEDIMKDARSTRIDFEQRIKTLKNKLTGVETEVVELKETNKELDEKAKLLEAAKIDYINEEMGLSFVYPAAFGEVSIEEKEGLTGKRFIGSFSMNDKFKFGGIYDDYAGLSTSTEISPMETKGYIEKKKKYYFQIPGDENEDYEIKPISEIEFGEEKALFFDKNSFVNSEELVEIAIRENLGVLVNLDGEKVQGVSFVNMDFGLLSVKDFENLIKSIKIIN